MPSDRAPKSGKYTVSGRRRRRPREETPVSQSGHTHARTHAHTKRTRAEMLHSRQTGCPSPRRSHFLLLFAAGCWLVSWHKAAAWDVRLMIANTPGSISCTKPAFGTVGGVFLRDCGRRNVNCCLVVLFFCFVLCNYCHFPSVIGFAADCELSLVPVSHTSSSHKRRVQQLHRLSKRSPVTSLHIIHGEKKQMDTPPNPLPPLFS